VETPSPILNYSNIKDSHYRSFLDAIDDGFCIIEVLFNENDKAVDYRFLEVNSAFEAHTGMTNAVGKTIRDFYPIFDNHWFDFYGKVALTGEAARYQNYAESMGRYFNLFAYRFGEPESRQVAVLFSDITRQKKAEFELLKNEIRFKHTLDNLQEGCAILAYDWTYLYVNDNNAAHAHSTREKIIGRKITDVVPGVENSKFFEIYKRCMEERTHQQMEDSFTFPDGSTEWYEVFVHPVPEGIFLLSMNVTKRKMIEMNLKQALQDKEVLIKEVYHRTKNNMQVISSLLSLKGARISDETYRREFYEMKNRIQAMALVHDMLYQTNNLSRLNLGIYIKNLVNLLVVSHSDKSDKVKVQYDLCDYEVSIDAAIPCGIIITELVINVFKYAFRENKEGVLIVTLSRAVNNSVRLIISDDGSGIPDNEIFNEDKLGTQLVKSLVEDQLNGTITCENKNGTRWDIIFK
jgi:PAS domain S-box-containing protein